MTIQDPLAACREDIEAGGYTIAAILGDESGCDWAYSIGLHRSFSHPELLIVGLDATIAGAILELLAARIADGEHLIPGSTVTIDGGMEFRLHLVDRLWCGQGDWFNLGREVMATWGERWPTSIQLTWSDADGLFPEGPGDPRWSFRQPLLFSV